MMVVMAVVTTVAAGPVPDLLARRQLPVVTAAAVPREPPREPE
jgi:hypothetical protein